MVKFFISLLFLVILVLLAVLAVQKDPGFVLIQYADFSLETSLAFGIIALVALSLLVQFLFRVLMSFLRLPRTLKKQGEQRRIEKSRKLLNLGLMDLAEGRFEQAEQTLLRLVDYAENPLLNYLTAARAAQQLGKYDERDNHLKAAHEARPEAEVAIAVTQAELQLASKQTERALATLNHLKTLAPKNSYVNKLLARVYFEIEEWQLLVDMLPEIKRKELFRGERLAELEQAAIHGCLEQSALQSDSALEKAWSKLPREYHNDPTMVLQYVRLLPQNNEGSRQAERVIVKAVNQSWNADLVEFYGSLQVEDSTAQLKTAEKWLSDYGNNDGLLLALGRICIRLKLWGKAQNYLEASVGIKATPQSCFELAKLLSRSEMDEHDKACEYFQQGLELSVGD